MIGSQAQLATSDVDVPSADSAANATMGDVIGNKTDTTSGSSLYAYILNLYNNIALESQVYPTLAAGTTVVTATADWTFGAYAEVVPANTITNNFDIHLLTIETCNKDAIFEMQLYSGPTDALVASVRFSVNSGFFGNSVYRISSAIVPANSRIRARMASSDGALNPATATISIGYIEE